MPRGRGRSAPLSALAELPSDRAVVVHEPAVHHLDLHRERAGTVRSRWPVGVILTRVGAVDGPILIAFDGSPAARRAVGDAARLLGPRPALVVTVWEPGLAYAIPEMRPEGLLPVPMVDPSIALDLDKGAHAQAEQVADHGAELARSQGLEAQPLAVPDERSVPDTILRVAEENRAAAIVVGSRGLSGLRARIEGSTTKALLKRASCPVIVVHELRDDR